MLLLNIISTIHANVLKPLDEDFKLVPLYIHSFYAGEAYLSTKQPMFNKKKVLSYLRPVKPHKYQIVIADKLLCYDDELNSVTLCPEDSVGNQIVDWGVVKGKDGHFIYVKNPNSRKFKDSQCLTICDNKNGSLESCDPKNQNQVFDFIIDDGGESDSTCLCEGDSIEIDERPLETDPSTVDNDEGKSDKDPGTSCKIEIQPFRGFPKVVKKMVESVSEEQSKKRMSPLNVLDGDALELMCEVMNSHKYGSSKNTPKTTVTNMPDGKTKRACSYYSGEGGENETSPECMYLHELTPYLEQFPSLFRRKPTMSDAFMHIEMC